MRQLCQEWIACRAKISQEDANVNADIAKIAKRHVRPAKAGAQIEQEIEKNAEITTREDDKQGVPSFPML